MLCKMSRLLVLAFAALAIQWNAPTVAMPPMSDAEPPASSEEPAEAEADTAPPADENDLADDAPESAGAVSPEPDAMESDASESETEPGQETGDPPRDPYAESTEPQTESPEPDPDAPAALPQSPKAAELLPAKPAVPLPPRVTLDPATLDGVHPGTTTRDELHEKWGQPKQSQRVAGGAREMYELDQLGHVRATIFEDLVTSLTVHTQRPAPLEAMIARLGLGAVEPVSILDEQGELLGAAFPERGVLLGYVPRSQPPQVFQVVVEAIDAQPFLARAEVRLHGRYLESLADVEQALALSPEHPIALHLRGVLLLKRCELDEALKSAERAAELEPQVAEHRLLIAEVLAAAGDYPQAINRVRDLLDEPELNDLDAARASCQWGNYLAHSHLRDYAEAIKYHQQAIQLAEPLMSNPARATRRAAKQVLLEAHLGVAYDIGRGRWQQKVESVAKWVNRAAVFADDLMRNEQAGAEVRLQVYMGALAAIGGIAEPPDINRWASGTRALGQKLYEQSEDAVYRGELAWQLARTMSEVVEIETTRGNSDEALAAGSLARSLFEEAQPLAGKLPTFSYEHGQLLYRVGATYAVDRTDHAQAVVWFNRAAPLLETPVPSAAVDAGVQGETFVSMGVSYWEQEDQKEALRLTNQGLKLMEQAVEEGTLEAVSLAIPYGNLAAMHEMLGDPEQAKWCADLASRYEAAAGQTK